MTAYLVAAAILFACGTIEAFVHEPVYFAACIISGWCAMICANLRRHDEE